jgi:putative Mg2+ transporter-C (MgtC) family protein
MVSNLDIILRVLIAAVLGAVIGYERERQNQPAGLRTHVILVVGSALAMVLSINMALQYLPQGTGGDPTRLAAQVISGIGFLGAGAILRYGVSVKGLSTAASLWTMAIVGLAVGGGYYIPALVTTALLLVTLVTLNFLERRFIRQYVTLSVSIIAEDRPNILEESRQVMLKHVKTVSDIRIEKNFLKKRVRIQSEVTFLEGKALESLMDDLALIKGVRGFKIL